MNTTEATLAALIERARVLIDIKAGQGQDTTVNEAKLRHMEATLAIMRGVARLELFEESSGADSYSAERAETYFRAAGELYLDAARVLQNFTGHLQADVLRSAGLEDA